MVRLLLGVGWRRGRYCRVRSDGWERSGWVKGKVKKGQVRDKRGQIWSNEISIEVGVVIREVRPGQVKCQKWPG